MINQLNDNTMLYVVIIPDLVISDFFNEYDGFILFQLKLALITDLNDLIVIFLMMFY